MLRTLLATSLLLAGPSLAAAEHLSMGSLRGSVPVEYVTTLVSQEGEDKHAFLRRLGGIMAAYTQRTGFEACGTIFAGNGRVGVVVTSSLAHAACVATNKSPGMGMASTDEGVHSHPQDRSYTVNAIDAVFSGYRHRLHTHQSVNPKTFSGIDYAAGSGYLVTGGQLLYQSGPGTEQALGAIGLADPGVMDSIVAQAR